MAKQPTEYMSMEYGKWIDRRREKRYGPVCRDAVIIAQGRGHDAAFSRSPKRNPYPPGKRRDAWDYGMKSADPMGDHHGLNY